MDIRLCSFPETNWEAGPDQTCPLASCADHVINEPKGNILNSFIHIQW